MKKIIALVAVVALCGAASTACVSRTVPTGSLPVPDPSDPYSAFLADELLTINSAMRELEYRCYADNGYPEYLEVLPAQKANQFRSAASTPDFKTTFGAFSESPWFSSEENARATGYGSSIPGLDAQVAPDDRSILKVFEDCRQSSLRRTSGNEDVASAYSHLGNVLAETLATSPSQNKDALKGRVFECMNNGRYPVDPNGPNKSVRWGVDFGVPLGVAPRMPEAVDLTRGAGTKVIPAEPTQHYFPTAEESESAAAMYRCSVETGAKAEWDKANNDAKRAALAKNEVTLTELNPKIKELAKAAAAAVQTKSSSSAAEK